MPWWICKLARYRRIAVVINLSLLAVAIFYKHWDESVKRDLKDWNISKEIALDRSVWSLAINVPEP